MPFDPNQKLEIKSIAALEAIFDEHLLIEDRSILKVMCATFVANQFKGFPNWLFIIAPSSGGKSELIQAFNGVTYHNRQMVFPISDLTVNALASGQKKVGKETSLLHQIPPGGMMVFKDFTSMVSKAKEARTEIFKQLREIFDGHYIKRTGTGDNVEWSGKIGAIAGATEVIYEYQQEFAAMGDRFVMYNMIQPDRRKVLDFIMDDARINSDKQAMQQHLKAGVSAYMEYLLDAMNEEDVALHPDLKEDMKNVADFCTRVRSGIVTDERRPNIINFVPTPEMPIRMINQLINVAKAFLIMRRLEPAAGVAAKSDNITEEESLILYKIAFDSIPIKRRMALKALAKYNQGVSTKGLATAINYQTNVVNAWLAQLNALGICTREHKGGNKGDTWNLKPQYRDIMVRFEKIEVVNEALIDEDDTDMGYEDQRPQHERTNEMMSLDAPSQDGFGDFESFRGE